VFPIPKKRLICLLPVVLVTLLFCIPAWSKMMMMSYGTLLKKADLIVIARVLRVQTKGNEQKNTLKVEEVLKGEWPLKKPIVIMTTIGRREDKLRLGEPGFKAILFMSKDEKGEPWVVHSIQGVWPLDGNTPAGYGLGKSLEQLREDIKQQGK
jgi:hypothetical protein